MVQFFLSMIVVFLFILCAVIVSTYLYAYGTMRRSRRSLRRVNMTLSKAYRRRMRSANVDMSICARRVVSITGAFVVVAAIFILCLISSVR